MKKEVLHFTAYTKHQPLPYFHVVLTESAAELIGKSGGVQDVLAALRLFPNDVDLATSACGAIWSLAVNGKSIVLDFAVNLVMTVELYFRKQLQDCHRRTWFTRYMYCNAVTRV